MVTDDERDYMYRAYAIDPHARFNLGIRHRLAPLLSNDRRRIELMNALLFSLPGTPVIYYGDEIGMGDNIYLGDRNGVRTPMQWSSDRNAGFSRANPQKLYLPVIIDPEYHYEAVNVEAQQNNPSSLLWWMKRLIALRKRFRAFGRGSIEFLRPENPKICAFIRRYGDERILLVANLSRFVQCAELDLREFRGLVPEELFGLNHFPPIGDQPYSMIMGPHAAYWFALVVPSPGQRGDMGSQERGELPVIHVPDHWEDWLFREEPDRLEALLPEFLRQFDPAAHPDIASAEIRRVFTLRHADILVHWLVIRVEYRSRMSQRLLLPVALIPDESASTLLEPLSKVGIARLAGARTGLLCEALVVPDCAHSLLGMIQAGKTLVLPEGELAAEPLPQLAQVPDTELSKLPVALNRSSRMNTTLSFAQRYIIKTYRRIEEGVNPDVEIATFLSNQRKFGYVAPPLGVLEYRRRNTPPITLAILSPYIENQGTAWQHTLNHLSSFFERVAALSPESMPGLASPASAAHSEGASAVEELIGSYLISVRQMGLRTGTLHQALGGDKLNPSFAPEPFGRAHQRSLYQSMRNLTNQLCTRITRQQSRLSGTALEYANQVYARQEFLLERFRTLLSRPIGGSRIRCHGDYHLGQLLHTGNDFVIIDFEGDPEQTIGNRRLKHSPLRDVVSFIRSFDYAAHTVLHGLAESRGRAPGVVRSEDRPVLEPWALWWSDRVSQEFVSSYLEQIGISGLIPESGDERQDLMDVLLLESVLGEIGRALDRPPEWMIVPFRRLVTLLGENGERQPD